PFCHQSRWILGFAHNANTTWKWSQTRVVDRYGFFERLTAIDLDLPGLPAGGGGGIFFDVIQGFSDGAEVPLRTDRDRGSAHFRSSRFGCFRAVRIICGGRGLDGFGGGGVAATEDQITNEQQ